MANLRQWLGRQEGFTLIELLIVLVILGILLAIAVPAYLGFRDEASNRAVEADIRAAVPSAEAYFESKDTYANMDASALKNIDAGLSKYVSVASGSTTGYCLTATIGSKTWSLAGPGATGWYTTDDCTGAKKSP